MVAFVTLELFLRECVEAGVTDMTAHVEIKGDEVILKLNPANVVDEPQVFAVRDARAIPLLWKE